MGIFEFLLMLSDMFRSFSLWQIYPEPIFAHKSEFRQLCF